MMKSVVAGARSVVAGLPVILRDLTGLAGAGLVAYGAWLIYPPAGFIVGGVLLIVAAALAALAQRPGG
ncbi:hypothetical protein UFOVP860_17 [uncultured Caudovirales phage]|uniref:Uncharacterized protein n=1 Tax=uncultured Caudovirales phage TaxID=2100421 RepID=A0A6J5PIB6_9CAUD|nr:hypothetical protein UFOVP860_17 [uncultured Caudovirales phage]CAB4196300.1 hypothetical protein UFOVP1293_93 [uncultured Caudovirales phage]CAB4222341.1 hypothetical protein UFOVP1644_16 [uncultured Caudovirales phage]